MNQVKYLIVNPTILSLHHKNKKNNSQAIGERLQSLNLSYMCAPYKNGQREQLSVPLAIIAHMHLHTPSRPYTQVCISLYYDSTMKSGLFTNKRL
jgi:hypothetical protein